MTVLHLSQPRIDAMSIKDDLSLFVRSRSFRSGRVYQ